MADHHPLDVWPLPRDQKPMFINEPWLVDESIYLETYAQMQAAREPEDQPDNRRVYIPLDLNKGYTPGPFRRAMICLRCAA